MRLTVVPAIDLRGGRCVRLLRGDPRAQTPYDADPVARARAFAKAGARRLHVVDLDGAFGSGENLHALRAICAAIDIPVQTGGGIRRHADVVTRFEAGAAFAILGTILIEAPEVVRALVAEFGSRLNAGVDARGASVAMRGWGIDGGRDRDELMREIASWGIERVVYTEIARDGTGEGYDVEALAHVAEVSGLRITASGGARTVDDLRALVEHTPPNVDAAILGRALYEKTMTLEEAISWTRELSPS